jgi:nucleoside-diphosphate-sugar epimerase
MGSNWEKMVHRHGVTGMSTVLVTGGTGFIAQTLFSKMDSESWNVRTTVRNENDLDRLPKGVLGFVTGKLEAFTDWEPLLEGVDSVVHLAARVHVMKEAASDPLAAFRQVNVVATERLAREATKAGVRRFIFVSSIGVCGQEVNKQTGLCYSEADAPAPYNPYTISKWEAEQILHRISKETGLQSVVLRPPLVYGPDAPGNFDRLITLVYRGLPLPLAGVKNRRSFVYVGNLTSSILACLKYPKALCQTFLVSDGEDLSTPELIRRIAHALGRPARLLPFPASLLRLAGWLTGQTETTDRLLNTLVVDSSKIRRTLDWTPPYSIGQGLQRTAEWFKAKEASRNNKGVKGP